MIEHRREQQLREDRLLPGAEFFKQNALVRGVLVDEQKLPALLDEDIGIKHLADDAVGLLGSLRQVDGLLRLLRSLFLRRQLLRGSLRRQHPQNRPAPPDRRARPRVEPSAAQAGRARQGAAKGGTSGFFSTGSAPGALRTRRRTHGLRKFAELPCCHRAEKFGILAVCTAVGEATTGALRLGSDGSCAFAELQLHAPGGTVERPCTP